MPEIDDSMMLIKYNGTDWTEYTAGNSPLPLYDIISDLAFDQIGNLWITTGNNGIFIFNENGITPVDLISFSASVYDNNVTLNWITATEANNMGFEIEKSQKSKIKIGKRLDLFTVMVQQQNQDVILTLMKG
jgi:hypothetical protein